jgi:hypothetical protein
MKMVGFEQFDILLSKDSQHVAEAVGNEQVHGQKPVVLGQLEVLVLLEPYFE